jgi:hypothetical protein
MSRTHTTHGARELLRSDYPDRVKLAVRLATRGGRERSRKCICCGRTGVHVDVWIPHTALLVGTETARGLRIYWRCEECYQQGLTPELEARLNG